MVNIDNGLPVFEDSYINIEVPISDMKNVYTPKTQKLYLKPEKFSNIEIDLERDFAHLEEDNLIYIKNKLRHAKSGFFIPTSVNYDVVLYGLHGGAEWPGATLYKDKDSTNLIIPSNKTPWILRINFQDKKYLKILNNKYYNKTFNFVRSTRNFFTNLFKKTQKVENIPSDVNSLIKDSSYKITTSKYIDTSFRNRNKINNFFKF